METSKDEISTDIITDSLFAQNSVIILEDKHFTTANDNLIYLDTNKPELKNLSCVLILFFSDVDKNKELIRIWSSVASQTPGPIFSAVDLSVSKEVASSFNMLNTINHPLYWARSKSIPFILTYQSGIPIGVYNGYRDIESIAEFSLTLACSINHHK